MNKEYIKEFALKKKEETGKFPLCNDWIIKNGYPIGKDEILKDFDSKWAKEFDVSNGTITYIRLGNTWKYIEI